MALSQHFCTWQNWQIWSCRYAITWHRYSF